MRLGLFSGSFDPPHIGHQMAMTCALATAKLDKLLLVPYFKHPVGKRLTDYEHRLAMCKLAVEPFVRGEGSDLERRFGSESRTLRTVQEIYGRHMAQEVVLIIGADLVRERERWYGYRELAKMVEFCVIGRAGQGGEVPVPNVSSTEIRGRVARGESIEGLVAASVREYIAEHRLYLDTQDP
ncbi:MAG: nicotinate-nicotinamide nucleotide adenylyltransferase [Myxococcales bacterium]|nr:nicotinate-nicotinamide nucleotide adenylyltransferase [Myxococcales bacterium]